MLMSVTGVSNAVDNNTELAICMLGEAVDLGL